MNTHLTFRIHEVVWLMDHVADDILRHHLGIEFKTGRFLMIVGDQEPCSQRRLAECLLLSAPAITKMLPGFVANGWVHVGVDPKQPRRNHLHLTPKGRTLASACRTILEESFRKLLKESGVRPETFAREIESIHSSLAYMLSQPAGAHS